MDMLECSVSIQLGNYEIHNWTNLPLYKQSDKNCLSEASNFEILTIPFRKNVFLLLSLIIQPPFKMFKYAFDFEINADAILDLLRFNHYNFIIFPKRVSQGLVPKTW